MNKQEVLNRLFEILKDQVGNPIFGVGSVDRLEPSDEIEIYLEEGETVFAISVTVCTCEDINLGNAENKNLECPILAHAIERRKWKNTCICDVVVPGDDGNLECPIAEHRETNKPKNSPNG